MRKAWTMIEVNLVFGHLIIGAILLTPIADNSVTAWDHTFAFDDLQDDAGCACRNCPTNGTLREFLRGS